MLLPLRKYLPCIISALFLSLSAQAQVMGPLGNLRSLSFDPDSLPITLRDVPVPGTYTFYLPGRPDLSLNKYFEIRDNTIKMVGPLPDSISHANVTLKYRIFSKNLSLPYRLMDTSIILPGWDPTLSERELRFASSPLIPERNVMNYRGAFTRGISLGNTQSLALNSVFNMQLSGELGDDIKIVGALSDNSIPIQPDGNSQQLQEFDKIYIVLSRKNSSLTVGDFELNRPPGYFLNYFKKLQGVQVSNTTTIKNNKLSTSGGIAVTKGKFNRFTLTVTEGNQGPYRLPGAEGEAFVIVLAGTERVYLDGILLARGFDRDYTIDYNSGEITFTPSRIITKDSRIVVEYEYSNQQYLRSFANMNVRYQTKKWDLNLNAYNERDGKNSARGRELTAEDKMILQQAGDSITNKLVNSIREIDPSNKSVVVSYMLKDTVINNQPFSFLVFPWKEGNKRYLADFTDVGQGNGYYDRVNDGVNGRVYRFAGIDVGGKPKGRYNPVSRLTAPTQRQMFTAGAAWKPDTNTVIMMETSLSGQDNNLFSSRDDGDNYGVGVHLFAERKNIRVSGKRKWTAGVGSEYENIGLQFSPITPYRSQEFNRDWNIANIPRESQQYVRLFLNQNIGTNFRLNYALSGLFQPVSFRGVKQEAALNYKLKKMELRADASYLKSESINEASSFLRPNVSISRAFPRLGGLTLIATYQGEFNRRHSVSADTLLGTSFAFQVMRFTAQNTFSKNFTSEIYVQRRNDYLPYTHDLLLANHALEYGLKSTLKAGQASVLNLTTTVRTFDADRTKPGATFNSKDTYLGQLDYLFSALKNRLSGNTLFEVSSGQEQKTEFNYVAVQPGTGQYVWNDYNRDSIQQVNEFTTEGFPEMRNYVRVNILTNQFIPTLNTSFNQSFRWQGKSTGKNKTARFFNRFSSQTGYRFDRKIKDTAKKGFWNPFYTNIPDSSLVTYLENFRHTFFFNRGDARYEVQLNANTNNVRNVQITGYERRRTDVYGLVFRYSLGAPYTLFFNYNRSHRISDSEAEAFKLNNFSIDADEIRPEFNWIVASDYRISLNYRFLRQKNKLAPQFEKASSNDFKLNFDFNQNSRSNLRLTTTISIIRFDGVRNSAVEFAMLEGLKNGRNYLWSVNYDLNLKNNVQLSFGYDGRKSEGINTVHTGNASVKAYF